jgi:hypothetical protein
MLNDLLANVVFLVHVAVILFFIAAPFTNSPTVWVLAAVSGIFVMSHWKMDADGKDTCCLTVCERWLRGCDSTDSFFHNIMSPIYLAVDKERGGTFTNDLTNRMVWGGMIALTVANIALITTNWKRTVQTFKK